MIYAAFMCFIALQGNSLSDTCSFADGYYHSKAQCEQGIPDNLKFRKVLGGTAMSGLRCLGKEPEWR